MRPARRTLFLLFLGIFVALFVTFLSERLWPLWLGYVAFVMVAFALDFVLSVPRRRLKVEVKAPKRLYMGDPDTMTIDISSSRPRSAEFEVVVDLGQNFEPQPRVDATMTAGKAEVSLELTPRRRGLATIDTVWLRWTGPLSLVQRQHTVAIDRTVKVVPNTRAVRRAALQLFSREAQLGMKLDKHRGDGSEFDALREYVPGYDHRRIDWKHSARHRKLVCKEFRAERNHPVLLAIDTGHLMCEPLGGVPKLDWAINAALLLGYSATRWGDRVGLLAFAARTQRFTEPVAGVAGFRRLQEMTAELEYRTEETNFTLGLSDVQSRLKRRTLIVVLTDFTDSITAEMMVRNLSRLNRKHMILFVSLRSPTLRAIADQPPGRVVDVARSLVASGGLDERDKVLDRLRRSGVVCIDAAPQQISAELLNRYVDIKRRELV